MAQRKALTLVNGYVQELPSGDTLAGAVAAHSVSMTNANASAITIGQVVYCSGADEVDLARANADGTSKVLGLVSASSISNGASGAIQTDGVLSTTTTNWDALTGQTGGLTPGSDYILSPDTAGSLVVRSSTIDAGEWIVPVGKAISTTDMLIDIEDGIKRA